MFLIEIVILNKRCESTVYSCPIIIIPGEAEIPNDPENLIIENDSVQNLFSNIYFQRPLKYENLLSSKVEY